MAPSMPRPAKSHFVLATVATVAVALLYITSRMDFYSSLNQAKTSASTVSSCSNARSGSSSSSSSSCKSTAAGIGIGSEYQALLDGSYVMPPDAAGLLNVREAEYGYISTFYDHHAAPPRRTQTTSDSESVGREKPSLSPTATATAPAPLRITLMLNGYMRTYNITRDSLVQNILATNKPLMTVTTHTLFGFHWDPNMGPNRDAVLNPLVNLSDVRASYGQYLAAIYVFNKTLLNEHYRKPICERDVSSAFLRWILLLKAWQLSDGLRTAASWSDRPEGWTRRFAAPGITRQPWGTYDLAIQLRPDITFPSPVYWSLERGTTTTAANATDLHNKQPPPLLLVMRVGPCRKHRYTSRVRFDDQVMNTPFNPNVSHKSLTDHVYVGKPSLIRTLLTLLPPALAEFRATNAKIRAEAAAGAATGQSVSLPLSPLPSPPPPPPPVLSSNDDMFYVVNCSVEENRRRHRAVLYKKDGDDNERMMLRRANESGFAIIGANAGISALLRGEQSLLALLDTFKPNGKDEEFGTLFYRFALEERHRCPPLDPDGAHYEVEKEDTT